MTRRPTRSEAPHPCSGRASTDGIRRSRACFGHLATGVLEGRLVPDEVVQPGDLQRALPADRRGVDPPQLRVGRGSPER